MAGVSRLQYANEMRLIRVMCSGRVDLEFILRAFSTGQDGVFIGGCKLNECNYVTHGNYDALGNTYIAKKILQRIGIHTERLRIEFMSSGDGMQLAGIMDGFSESVKTLGPLGSSEGLDRKTLTFKLDTARKLVPYIRLVERERLRVPSKSKAAYENFFTSDAFNRLFDELIGDSLTAGQITSILSERPRSTAEIAEKLQLNPSEVSRHMKRSSQHGLVRYDVDKSCYTLA
ncbi:MAG: hydrogenase iron-sulfur subunit [Desulfatitalea sp.]|nr:hydrogenase iron-sulfur subunit [Desulfatitalea sp.]NNJ99038.1 hydrogenase iron-sulfur subunit [Desulfatitalea sp.]